MKKIKLLSMFALLALLMPSCKQEEIVFDYEKVHFEVKSDAILLEVVVPTSTQQSDDLYVAGAFTGGDDAARQNAKFHLTPHPDSNAKWGVYLYPADFANGKTLADGFHFMSVNQREERGLKNEEVMHYESPEVGTRTIITIQQWAAYFDKVDNPDDIEHDGYVIYIENQTGWSEIAMYAWGDGLPELCGSWPGMLPTGIIEKNGKRYTYFDTGAANEGLTYNLIFNNNNNGEQYPHEGEPSFPVTLDKDYYLTVTATSIEEQDAAASIEHDGYVVYALNQTGYDELALYGWYANQEELFGGWPGKVPDGEVTIAGNKYVYFDMGKEHDGMSYHLIFNNKDNGKQLPDFDFEITRDIYLQLAPGGASEIDPKDVIPEPEPEPDPVPVVDPREDPDAKEYKIFVSDKTGWDEIAVYAYGTNLVEIFGGWPGEQLTEKQNVEGQDYLVVKIKGNKHQYKLIFNNNGNGVQVAEFAYTIDHDAYLEVTADGVKDLKTATEPAQE